MKPDLTPEQIAANEQIEKDMKTFNDGLTALIQKTGITIVAKVAFSEDGIRPTLKLARLTPQAASAPAAPVKPAKKNGKKK